MARSSPARVHPLFSLSLERTYSYFALQGVGSLALFASFNPSEAEYRARRSVGMSDRVTGDRPTGLRNFENHAAMVRSDSARSFFSVYGICRSSDSDSANNNMVIFK